MNEEYTNVLLIGNNPEEALKVQNMLSKVRGVPFNIECIDRFSSALTRLSDDRLDVVLLSFSQQEVNDQGLDMLDKLHDHAPSLPVIVLSDFDDEAFALKVLQRGAQEYLIKEQLNSNMLTRVLRYGIKRNRMLAELEQNSQRQLQLKEQFLSHVSHELRSPLAVIYQFVTILLDEVAGKINQDQREYLEITLRNVNQFRAMIGDLLEITRVDTGKLTIETRCISLFVLITETNKMFQANAAMKNIDLNIDIPSDLPAVYGDPERVRQILTNIINNAIKFTLDNGRISISAHVWEENPKFICVEVADTGCGIKPKDTQMIFDRLYQEAGSGEEGRKGLGLGLYICKELVTRHGGQIWVESQQGKGSTFLFTLPVFSLSNLLTPVFTEDNRLKIPVAIIKVEVFSPDGSNIKISETTLRETWDVLQRCTLPDLDVLLPRIDQTKEGETFFLVACADYKGTEVLVRRIKQQLARCDDLHNAGIKPQVSFSMIDIPDEQNDKPLEQQINYIVTSIEESILSKEVPL